jgi:hypothetical protein
LYRRTPFASFEQRSELTRGESNSAGCFGRWPNKLSALKPLGQKAQANAVMPKDLDQSGIASAKGKDRAAERIIRQPLLHQHGQSDRPFSHIRNATGQVNPHPARRPDHRLSSAASTCRNAWPSTCESTRKLVPPGNMISMRPVGLLLGLDGRNGGGFDGGAALALSVSLNPTPTGGSNAGWLAAISTRVNLGAGRGVPPGCPSSTCRRHV